MKITITAHSDKIKPAHKATVVRTGEGSNLWTAITDGVRQVKASKAFSGKRGIFPIRFTIQEYIEYGEVEAG